MDEKLMELLGKECENLIQNIKKAAPGSPEAKGAIYTLQNYHKMLIEEKKIFLTNEKQVNEKILKEREMDLKDISTEADRKMKETEMEMRKSELEMKRESVHEEYYFKDKDLNIKESEQKLKQTQAKEGKMDRIIGYVLTGAGIIIPVIASGYWMAKGMKFEETGTYTSRTMQWISNHFRLFKGKNG